MAWQAEQMVGMWRRAVTPQDAATRQFARMPAEWMAGGRRQQALALELKQRRRVQQAQLRRLCPRCLAKPAGGPGPARAAELLQRTAPGLYEE